MTDGHYLFLKPRYLWAVLNIGSIEKEQSNDKKLLKITSNEDEKKIIRHRLASRRLGPKGLRAMNKHIRRFINYCDKFSEI